MGPLVLNRGTWVQEGHLKMTREIPVTTEKFGETWGSGEQKEKGRTMWPLEGWKLACPPAAPLTWARTPFSAHTFSTLPKSSRGTTLRAGPGLRAVGRHQGGARSCMLPGDVQALAVKQGCTTLQFGVFDPAGAVAALAWQGDHICSQSPTCTAKKAQVDCRPCLWTSSLWLFPWEDYHIGFSQNFTGALQWILYYKGYLAILALAIESLSLIQVTIRRPGDELKRQKGKVETKRLVGYGGVGDTG